MKFEFFETVFPVFSGKFGFYSELCKGNLEKSASSIL